MIQDILLPFLSVGLAELGDKTQLAAAVFAASLDPLLVFLGSVLALLVLSVAAVYAGKFVASKIDRRLISRAAGILFILIGLGFLLL